MMKLLLSQGCEAWSAFLKTCLYGSPSLGSYPGYLLYHIKSTQCIEETNTNLQINRYLPHTTDFIFINCMVTSTNRLHLLSTFTLYTVSIIVGNIESNLKKKVLVCHTRLVLYRLIVANIDLCMFISTKTNINLLIPLV